MATTTKRFRFESFAQEFASCKEEHEDIPDNDSGIDSSEDPAQVSPPLDQQPKRHWKKFLKDQAEDLRVKRRRSPSPSNVSVKRRLSPSPPISVAQALLSLRHPAPMADLPLNPRPLPIPVPPTRHSSAPWPRPFSENRDPWMKFEQNEPQNLSLKQTHLPISPMMFAGLPAPPPPTSSPSRISPLCPLKEINRPMPMGDHLLKDSNRPLQLGDPLREIHGNNRPIQLPTQPLPSDKFMHPAFHSENYSSSPTPSPPSSSSSKPFHCHDCKKSFSTQSGYAKHQQLHCTNQIQKNFSCKYCNKGYTSLSALKMHIRTHTLPCKCDICGKSFSRPWLLQGHVRTHTGEKPFSCTYCARSFADKSNLRAHLQTHLQTKKYSCPGCNKTFSRMSLLNKHTDSGCANLQSRNEECVQTLIGLSAGQIRT